jgi:hypothetical protein
MMRYEFVAKHYQSVSHSSKVMSLELRSPMWYHYHFVLQSAFLVKFLTMGDSHTKTRELANGDDIKIVAITQ